MLVRRKSPSVLQACLASLVPMQSVSSTLLEHATRLQPVLEALDAIRADNATFLSITTNDSGPPTITSCASTLDDANAQPTALSKRKSKQFVKKSGFTDDALLTRCLVQESEYASQLTERHRDDAPLVRLDSFLPEKPAEIFTLVKVGSGREPSSWYVERGTSDPVASPSVYMSVKLKEFVRSIRQCKTISEEKALIARELALIRTAFKDGSTRHSARNMAKLIFISMYGEPTSFGLIECVKMTASSEFLDKRIGYLGVVALMDHSQGDMLTLLTNCIKKDLEDSNQYIAGIAMGALAVVANPDLARSLGRDVQTLLEGSNPYLVKRAASCAAQLIRACPEEVARYMDLLPGLWKDSNHGVQLAAATLTEAVLGVLDVDFDKLIGDVFPVVLKHIQDVPSTAEVDINGLPDPFLQARLARVLATMAVKDQAAAARLRPVLKSVADGMDTTKNAGASVVFECASALLAISSATSVPRQPKVVDLLLQDDSVSAGSLESNTVVSDTCKEALVYLESLLASEDVNVKFAALECLASMVGSNPSAVREIAHSVTPCLHDDDQSIRSRALAVCSSAISRSNVQETTRDYLHLILENQTDPPRLENVAFVNAVLASLSSSVTTLAPNRRWMFDTLLKLFCLTDNAPDHSVFQFVEAFRATPELHLYLVHRVFHCLRLYPTKPAVVFAALQLIGLEGHLLFTSPGEGYPCQEADGVVATLLETGQILAKSHRPSDFFFCPADMFSVSGVPTNRVPEVNHLLHALVTCATRLAHQLPAGADRLILTLFSSLDPLAAMDAELEKRLAEGRVLLTLDLNDQRQLLESEPARCPPGLCSAVGDVGYIPGAPDMDLVASGKALQKLTSTAAAESTCLLGDSPKVPVTNGNLLSLDSDRSTSSVGPVVVASPRLLENTAVAKPDAFEGLTLNLLVDSPKTSPENGTAAQTTNLLDLL